jgi:hypothetical protein
MAHFNIKPVQVLGRPTAIILQGENGPCPLLSLSNSLILQQKITLPLSGPNTYFPSITFDSLVALVRGHLLGLAGPANDRANYDHLVGEACEVLPGLNVGLDVNVAFDGGFEFSRGVGVFDLLGVALVHGWLPQDGECADVREVERLSYNSLVERVIVDGESEDPGKREKAEGLRLWLEITSSQLTERGLEMLAGRLKDGQVAVLFRNNHFATLVKHAGALFTLVTDEGYLRENDIVFESLTLHGDPVFFTGAFTPSPKKSLERFNTEISQASEGTLANRTIDPEEAEDVIQRAIERQQSYNPPTVTTAAAAGIPGEDFDLSLFNDPEFLKEQAEILKGMKR